ncbi:hypothetical protein [Pseudomonas sp. KB-10]|uniref:hypothetical protein n=1 Tax=Pseudomonas sp. KB-10 TaxID=2292264 RepID=UPI001BAFD9B8|nr:hypothetical protein [Pseudomonas sp. KB-10]
MSDEEITYDDKDWEEHIDPEKYEATKTELRKRCDKAGIEIRETDGLEDNEAALELSFPCARDKRTITLWDYDDVKKILNIPFEKYNFLAGYSAICSYSENEIEASVRPLGQFSSRSVYRRLFGDMFDDEELREDNFSIELQPDAGNRGPSIVLGPASDALRAMSGPSQMRRLSIKLSNTGVTQHDQAQSLLEKMANSLFFQIELVSGVPLALLRQRRYIRPVGKKKQNLTIEDFQYPKNEYDDAPISLYWYARSAIGMPLLQFLAFYQVVEFYFPTYYQAEARRKIRSILKNPTFRSDRDADVGKILSAIQLGRAGSLGDERSQLRATITECVDPDSLREFVTETELRKDFFSSKTKGLTDHKLPIANPTIDLRNDVADRIYDIRCKIVHTKADSRSGEIELLLPFSKEAEQLHNDIELMQYISQQVLIAASTSI